MGLSATSVPQLDIKLQANWCSHLQSSPENNHYFTAQRLGRAIDLHSDFNQTKLFDIHLSISQHNMQGKSFRPTAKCTFLKKIVLCLFVQTAFIIAHLSLCIMLLCSSTIHLF